MISDKKNSILKFYTKEDKLDFDSKMSKFSNKVFYSFFGDVLMPFVIVFDIMLWILFLATGNSFIKNIGILFIIIILPIIIITIKADNIDSNAIWIFKYLQLNSETINILNYTLDSGEMIIEYTKENDPVVHKMKFDISNFTKETRTDVEKIIIDIPNSTIIYPYMEE